MSPGKRSNHQVWRGLRRLVCLTAWLSLVATQCGMPPTPSLPSSLPAQGAVRVAVLTPMTGELATFGETVRNGISLAFDEWSDQVGADGQPIEWVLEDTRCDPLEARRAAERAVSEYGVQFIVGGVCSEAAIPIARFADEQGALFIAATATHPLVTVDGDGVTRPLVFRAGYAYPYQGRAAARFALGELDARRAVVLTNPGDDFVRSLGGEFIAAFVAGGGQVVANPTYDPQDVDFDTLMAEIASTTPQVLYVPDAYPVANRVGSHVQTQGLDVTLLGSDVWDSGALDLEVLEGAYFTIHYSREAPSPIAAAWRERYLSAFAVEPDTLAALGYDAASLLASALQEAGTPLPGDVARTLERIEFVGVTGRWRFDARHNPIKPIVVVRVEGGDVVFYDVVQLQ